MYAQLTIVATFSRPELSRKLIEQIGVNRVRLEIGLQGTPFERDMSIRDRIVATELIQNSASLVYFFEGSDTISVHIQAATVSELKQQAVRVTRQLRPLVNKWKRVSASVSVLIRERGESADPIIEGEYQRKRKRMTDALADKWLGKLLSPAIIFPATYFLASSSAATSALIALIAAVVTFGAEAVSAARGAEEWKWKDAT
jgi:hypothetical protein